MVAYSAYAFSPAFMQTMTSVSWGDNLVTTNAGFESATDFEDWTVIGSPSISTLDPYEGSQDMSCAATGTRTVTRIISGLVPGETYKLSGAVRRNLGSHVPYIDLYDSGCGLDTNGILVTDTDDTWRVYSEVFIMPVGCTSATLRVSNGGLTTTHHDIISLRKRN